jgi:hypothetical protein
MNDHLLRDQSTQEVIASAFRLYRDHFASLVWIALVPHLAMVVLELLIVEAALAPTAALALLLAATTVFNALVLAAMTYAIGQAVLGAMPGLIEAYRGGFGESLLSIIAAYLVNWALVTVGFLLLILPGLVVGGLLLPTVPVIVLEKRNPAQALSRAFRMMRPVALKATAVFAFVVLISGVLPLTFHLVVGPGPFSPLLGAIVGAVTLPLAHSANVVLYLSERAGEGYTREHLAAELAR